MLRNRDRLQLQLLETRNLLAAGSIDFDSATGILTAVGTDSDDAFYAVPESDQNVVFYLENTELQIETVSRELISKVVFTALDGDDLFWNGTDISSQVDGGDGADVIYGGVGDDGLLGGAGDDTISGGDGNDVIVGQAGDDTLLGNAGQDVLLGAEGVDTLYGGTNDDFLVGGEGNDSIYGGLGVDSIYGGPSDDFLYGDEGDDQIFGQAGSDWVEGGSGEDYLQGGTGADTLLGQLDDDRIEGGDDADTLLGGPGNDRLFGDAGNDLMAGEQGDDHLIGNEGNDQILGGPGIDFAWGLAGDDSIVGGDGSDALLGGDGADQIFGQAGRDILFGGDGADDLQGGDGQDVLIGGPTTYDNESDVDSIGHLLNLWSGAGDYVDRIALLEDPGQPAYLHSPITLLDDLVVDRLLGESGQDWFTLSGDFNSDLFQSPVNGSAPQFGQYWQILAGLDELVDLETSESIQTIVPHPRNPMMRRSHVALFDLVNSTTITDAAVQSGNWSDPNTWSGAQVPTAGARVRIEPGVTVTVDVDAVDPLDKILVGGTLDFAPSLNTHLRVDTIIVASHGKLQIGTEIAPIAAEVSAKISFTGDSPIDPLIDPFAFSRGLIALGAVEIHGAAVTPWSGLSVAPQIGQTELVLDEIPVNWRVGDELLLPGTNSEADEDELLTIEAIDGNTITVEPLAYDHVPPDSSLTVHLANLTRNVIIESEEQVVDRRGHVMLMHQRDVSLNFVALRELGRTDKTVVADSPVVDPAGNVQPGSGTNPRGRYSLHFHRNGVVNDGAPSRVHGSVVQGSPGWGFVNHSSFVDFTDNVAYNVDGAAFVTEAGDEIGTFIGNLAVRGIGSGDTLESRNDEQDYAHQGDGFWFQGAGVRVEDNVAAGHSGQGFVFFTLGLFEPGLGVREFLTSNLSDPSLANGAETIGVHDVPIQQFRRNTAYASDIGVGVLFSLLSASHSQSSVIEQITAWNNRTGIDLQYTANMLVRNVDVHHFSPFVGETGIDGNDRTQSITYNDVHVDGYLIGLRAPARGTNVVNGGTFQNVVNVFVETASAERSLIINGPIDFQSWVAPEFGFDIWMNPNLSLTQNTIDLQHVFLPDTVTLNYGPYTNRRVYFREQTPDFVPFPFAEPGALADWIGLDGQDLFDQFGLRLGDAWAPQDAITAPRVYGLIQAND